ncbi:MAG: YaiI/YqxD family protein [Methylomonas sp.]
MPMTIWVDADACPNPVKTLLFRAAQKRHLTLLLVANQLIATPPLKSIRAIRVSGGFDAADDYILQHMQGGDLVITGDIPLASKVIEKQGHAIDPRGEVFGVDNIGEKLALRDFLEQMRNSGQITGGVSAMAAKDVQQFANALDRFLAAKQI